MKPITFKEYVELTTENEQLDKAVADLQAQIGQLDTTINQRTQSLINQKAQIQRRYAQLLKQKQAADRSEEQKQRQLKSQQPTDNKPAQVGNQAVTPGSAGANTPGQPRI